MNMYTFKFPKKSSHLTLFLYSNNIFNNNIFYELEKISKNIYNKTIYSFDKKQNYKTKIITEFNLNENIDEFLNETNDNEEN